MNLLDASVEPCFCSLVEKYIDRVVSGKMNQHATHFLHLISSTKAVIDRVASLSLHTFDFLVILNFYSQLQAQLTTCVWEDTTLPVDKSNPLKRRRVWLFWFLILCSLWGARGVSLEGSRGSSPRDKNTSPCLLTTLKQSEAEWESQLVSLSGWVSEKGERRICYMPENWCWIVGMRIDALYRISDALGTDWH